MPRATTASPVEVRTLAPPTSDDDSGLLYREVPQIEGDVPMKGTFMKVTPEQAREWLLLAAQAEEEGKIKQRRTAPRDIKRWQILMETNRFVEYLPDGPLCFNDEGILLNGKHRLSAAGQMNRPIGFMVIKHVPTWMFRFFDTGRGRTINDVFKIAGRATGAQTSSTMRLAMRYEEFLHGKRTINSWPEWKNQRDEHYDVDDFLVRREDLNDWYYVAQQIYGGAKMLIASAMAFRFYQSLAWPDGEEKIIEFCQGLTQGAMLAPKHPTLVLREWGRQSFADQERFSVPKRELHLMLLFRHFRLAVQGERIEGRLRWARGFPMDMPYHPDGPEVAVKNVLAALTDMDQEAASANAFNGAPPHV